MKHTPTKVETIATNKKGNLKRSPFLVNLVAENEKIEEANLQQKPHRKERSGGFQVGGVWTSNC